MDNPLPPHLPDSTPLFRSTRRPAQPEPGKSDPHPERPDDVPETPEKLETAPGLPPDADDDENPLIRYAID